MPNAKGTPQPEAPGSEAPASASIPARDADPARSADDSGSASPADSSSATESSSNVPDIDSLRPRDDEDTKHGKKADATPEYHETAANDIEVGNYELERHNWKGALSRFQSAMVLDPQNPDVFWGMAEATRHLGDFSIARGYYQLVYDYDPESRHGKEARKALKDPEIANAQPAKTAPPSQK